MATTFCLYGFDYFRDLVPVEPYSIHLLSYFTWHNRISHRMDIPNLFIDGHLGHFYLLDTVNRAAMNMGMQIFKILLSIILDICT